MGSIAGLKGADKRSALAQKSVADLVAQAAILNAMELGPKAAFGLIAD